MLILCFVFFFVKQKTAYEMRISDWSSDVCSSDLQLAEPRFHDRSIARMADDVGLVLFDRPHHHPTEPDRFHHFRFETFTRDLAGFDVRERHQTAREPREQHRDTDAERRERSEERRVGHEGSSTWRSRGSPSRY